MLLHALVESGTCAPPVTGSFATHLGHRKLIDGLLVAVVAHAKGIV